MGLTRYSTLEVVKMLKITLSQLQYLRRTFKNRKYKGPLFTPEWPSEARGKGHSDYYSEEDIAKLQEYFNIIKIRRPSYEVLK